jgi:3-methyladenine DNA glycosylase AlkD
MTYKKVQKELKKLANPKKAKLLMRFFKTGKGEYGEGDIFLGIMVPQQREVVKKFRALPLSEIQKLLKSKFHEERLVGVLILVEQHQSLCHSGPRAGIQKKQLLDPGSRPGMTREAIFSFYLKNAKRINNWDLVDLSAPKIVGAYLFDKNRGIIYKLAKSKNLWERRIAVLATFWFIREKDFKDAIRLAEILLTDKHDLMHKAVGWMLREIGKRNEKILRQFLNKHVRKMPRMMLRYAIERLPEKDRQHYLLKH